MAKEFKSLSEKEHFGYAGGWFYTEDIKEFIERSLEIMDCHLSNRRKIERFRELAGPKLITKS